MDLNTIAEKAALAAQSAIQGFDMNQAAAAPHFSIQSQPQQVQLSPSQPPQFSYQFPHQTNPTSFYEGSPYQHAATLNQHATHQSADENDHHDIFGDPNSFPNQFIPTHALYERARMAETSKATPSTRRAGHPSQRRPWSTQEEAALLDGLDRVKGPHWSQILAMYGAGGSVSEALKDRNQVQLKDKARNFKLYFLKNNIQLPYSLSLVTGELRTRAPAQAAKNEAEERERLSEEYGYVDSGTTLAPGLGEENEQIADEVDGDGGNQDGYENHNDGNDINTDFVDLPTRNSKESPLQDSQRQQQPSEKGDDVQYGSHHNDPNEDTKTYDAETSTTRFPSSTPHIHHATPPV